MTYIRKTQDEYILLTNYGYGWDEEVTEETLRGIKQREKEYLKNTNAQIKIITRRIAVKENNTMTRQEQKIEAIARMKMLKLHENPIREFEEKDVINLSENGGILYWLDKTKRTRQSIRDKTQCCRLPRHPRLHGVRRAACFPLRFKT